MTDAATTDEPTEPDAEDDDPCTGAGGHSWEYLYSVFQCNYCEQICED